MPRSRGGRSAPARAPSAPSRPAAQAPPPRSMANQQQSRQMTTTAQRPPAQQAGAQQQQGKSPGLFGQMASTAAGVAVGSSIGHAIGGFFGGGSQAQQPAEDQQQNYASPTTNAYGEPMDQYNSSGSGSGNVYASGAQSGSGSGSAMSGQDAGPCATDSKTFMRCMDENRGDLTICGWYLDQLKACQQAARPY